MRHNATTITTTTIAESIVKNDPKINRTDEGSILNFRDEVAVVRERLERLAQLRNIDKDAVKGHESVVLLDAYDDRLQRGVYAAEEAKAESLVTL